MQSCRRLSGRGCLLFCWQSLCFRRSDGSSSPFLFTYPQKPTGQRNFGFSRERMTGKYKVTLVGSGNWGSAISKNVGSCVKRYNSEFDETVTMWVFEETVNGRKLTEIINTDHENVKYLPGIKLPNNIVAEPDLIKASKDADILVFVVPHQFVPRILQQLNGKIKPTAIGVSLIKGVGDPATDGSIKLISDEIAETLKIDVSVLMGANLANEVAAEKFCEGTIGCKDPEKAARLKRLFQTDNYRVHTVPDYHTVELCGALKNIVACAAGFVDGMELGDNTKAAIIRLGFIEMQRFIEHFYPGSNANTFNESCGIADLITTCYGGRNRRASEAFVKTGKSFPDLEKELLGGQHLQGPPTAAQVNKMLKAKDLENKYPLFTSVHNICTSVWKADELINQLRQAHI